ncbi:MAG: preprotein translocase subunit SecA [Bacteroidetes bacterium]|nr:preprotein translocase subunit SecA [Bacteroidota bacterium]
MLNGILKGLGKIFGSKSERDIKELEPYVEKINEYFQEYKSLSNDELRAKTNELKTFIKDSLKDIDEEVLRIRKEIEELPFEKLEEKDALYTRIDELEKERDTKLEEVLMEILPQAFAIVKDTARRFSENSIVEVLATENDKNIATRHNYVSINGNKAYYKNEWEAAGSMIKWNMVHYDVQLIGGIVLHQGKIAEMATGEGKTLVSTLPSFLNALGGRGVHVITVNDYLAKRDCEWNRPIFQFHGLSVDCIDYHRPNSPERKNAYACDIVYGTNNEFGFDYLRDNMSHTPEELVQGKLHFAMVDEVDSVLIDDARTPLIISGPVPKGNQQEFDALKPRIAALYELQRKNLTNTLVEAKRLIAEGKTGEKDGGLALLRCHRGLPKNKALIKFLSEPGIRTLLTKTENYYLQDQEKHMHIVDEGLLFVIDEKNNTIELSDRGIETMTKSGEEPDFFIMPDLGSDLADLEKSGLSEAEKAKKKDEILRNFSVKSERLHAVHQLLKAYTLFEKDIEYIVQDGKVKIVDEQTGRVLDGRRYSDGLHQAIEAKENVKIEAATQTYATITLQNYFRMYHKLSGMTGTAETEAGEFWEIYKLDVVVIPTNKPIIRHDLQDLLYKTTREKFNAVIEHIVELTKQGRPVLVGTTSVEISELLSRMLTMRKIRHNVLNAKQHQREAEIVAEAGKPGAVTIATNMAGRGTDIKITEEVRKAGGLAILGTERHESRRVDRQLRGRSGRQGDPGSSQFFVSLEDNLMRLFGSERASRVMDKLGYKEGEVLQHSMLSKNIERAQKKVEQNNFGIRKRLLEYDDVMNKQRTVIYSRRKNALFGTKIEIDIQNMLYDLLSEKINIYKEDDDYEGFKFEIYKSLAIDIEISEDEFKQEREDVVTPKVFEDAIKAYQAKNTSIIHVALPVLERIFKNEGNTVENVMVPFSDGIKRMGVVVNLKEVFANNGRSLIKSFEKAITLATIDDEWKDHLRELDDLKQTSNNAVFEQKDPLLIYKLESFNLFQSFMGRMNNNVLSFLFKARIDGGDENEVREARQIQKQSSPALKTSRDENVTNNTQSNHSERGATTPIKSEKLVGRNDPCPCGSGKKYKNCHGA